MEERRPDLVDRILAGELDEDAPSVRAELAAHPELAEELAELRALDGLLREDAAGEREALEGDWTAGARSPRRAPRGPARPRDRRRLLVAISLAAAALTAFLLVPIWLDGGGGRGDVPGRGEYLSGGTLKVLELAPQGVGQSLATFRVIADAPLPKGARVEIRIWDDAAPESAAPLLEDSSTLKDARPDYEWSPSPEELERLPDAIRWNVVVTALNGEVPVSARGIHASR